MESSSCLLLLCDEELLLPSPSPSPLPAKRHPESSRRPTSSSGFLPLSSNVAAADEGCDLTLQNYLLRERTFAPLPGYAQRLCHSDHLSGARTQAVQWTLLACRRLNLAIGTAFGAVNYLDRFISMNCCMKWEGWMIELLCIACLSIASKLDEVCIPSLHELQTEGLEHSFLPSTIQQMEMALLKALDWRLTCVTPYSYVELLLWNMDAIDAPFTTRIIELLLCALVDTRFLEYSAFSIAESALRCAIRELHPLDSDAPLSVLSHLVPDEHTVEMDSCRKIMEERVTCTITIPWSYRGPPATATPLQRAGISDSKMDTNRCFFEYHRPNQDTKKRKREEGVEEKLAQVTTLERGP